MRRATSSEPTDENYSTGILSINSEGESAKIHIPKLMYEAWLRYVSALQQGLEKIERYRITLYLCTSCGWFALTCSPLIKNAPKLCASCGAMVSGKVVAQS